MQAFYFYWLLVVVSLVLYAIIILSFAGGWANLKEFHPQSSVFSTRVSVIIAMHNEGKHIVQCLQSLLHQNIQTQGFEVIVVDDYSTDQSRDLAEKMSQTDRRIKVIKNDQRRGKKYALEQAIASSTGSLIVITDADCIHPKTWLSTLVAFYEQENPVLIIGPVTMQANGKRLGNFQKLEFAALVGSAGGASAINRPVLCNAANLAFEKSAYLELDDPFNRKLISGDDIFLLQQLKKNYTERIRFLKSADAMVITQPVLTFKSFIHQRTRWASKTFHYSDSDARFVAGVILSASFLMAAGLLAMPLKLNFWKPLLVIYLGKTVIDLIFFIQLSGFFKLSGYIRHLAWYEWFNSIYVSIVALQSVLLKLKSK